MTSNSLELGRYIATMGKTIVFLEQTPWKVGRKEMLTRAWSPLDANFRGLHFRIETVELAHTHPMSRGRLWATFFFVPGIEPSGLNH